MQETLTDRGLRRPLLKPAPVAVIPLPAHITIEPVTADLADGHCCSNDGCGEMLLDRAYLISPLGEPSWLVCSWACVCDVLRYEVSL